MPFCKPYINNNFVTLTPAVSYIQCIRWAWLSVKHRYTNHCSRSKANSNKCLKSKQLVLFASALSPHIFSIFFTLYNTQNNDCVWSCTPAWQYRARLKSEKGTLPYSFQIIFFHSVGPTIANTALHIPVTPDVGPLSAMSTIRIV